MRILVVDPAASTGYCFVEVSEDGHASIYQYGILDVQDSEYVGDRALELMDKIEKLINEEDVQEVAVEDYFFGGKFATGSGVNTAFRAAVHMATRKYGLHYEVLNVTEWKKWVAGRSTPTPPQKKKWGKEAAKKLMIQEALFEKHGFRFPNHSISPKTGKPILFRFDVVDAVGMAIFYLQKFKEVKSISLDVSVPPDQPVKKTKKYFQYPED